jgi:hypothetical protein
MPLAQTRSSPRWRRGPAHGGQRHEQGDLQPILDAALLDPRVDALVVAIGTGELICRKRQT